MNGEYISGELTHFAGKGKSLEEQYAILVYGILGAQPLLRCPQFNPHREGAIELNPEGRISSNATYRPPAVCFCDIPVPAFKRHMRQYGEFGLAFTKQYLAARGANPVFYVANGSRVTTAMDFLETIVAPGIGIRGTDAPYEKCATRAQLFDRLDEVFRDVTGRILKTPAIADQLGLRNVLILQSYLTYLVFCHLKCFDESADAEAQDNFYMEREWRILEPVEFSLHDVVRIILPDESWEAQFREDRPLYQGHLTLASRLPQIECVNACCNAPI